MRLYLYIAQVDLEENSRLGSLCKYEMHDIGLIWYWPILLCMLLTTLVIMIYEVKDNAYDIFASLLGLCRAMWLHIHIALVDFDEMDSKHEMLIMDFLCC